MMDAVTRYIDTKTEEAMYNAIEEDRTMMLLLLDDNIILRLIDEGVLEEDDYARADELKEDVRSEMHARAL